MFVNKDLFTTQVGLAVVNGQLYAVGGFDGTTYLKNVETFDQEVRLTSGNNLVVF